jgi:hypothetical protein
MRGGLASVGFADCPPAERQRKHRLALVESIPTQDEQSGLQALPDESSRGERSTTGATRPRDKDELVQILMDMPSRGLLAGTEEGGGDGFRVFEIAFAVHDNREKLRAAIARAQSYLQQHHDSEDPDAAQLPNDITWGRVEAFLLAQSRLALQLGHVALLDIPFVSVADGGSVDLYWRDDERTLLINIPEDLTQPASYYGQNVAGTVTMGGSVATDESTPMLAVWLIRRRR